MRSHVQTGLSGPTLRKESRVLDDGADVVVLVDHRDREIGVSEKIAAHEAPGRLHRAFSVFYSDRTAHCSSNDALQRSITSPVDGPTAAADIRGWDTVKLLKRVVEPARSSPWSANWQSWAQQSTEQWTTTADASRKSSITSWSVSPTKLPVRPGTKHVKSRTNTCRSSCKPFGGNRAGTHPGFH
jgi:hypothetical protein